jgi:hypothetical protein
MFNKKKIFNFDESAITATTSRCYSRQDPNAMRGRNFRRELSGFSLMLAISEDGLVLHNFIYGNNN